jgi:hypothetical protein
MPPRLLDLRLGVDVGGTNTDAVVLDREDRLIARAKVPTTADVSTGIALAAAEALAVEKTAGNHPRHARDHARDERRARAEAPAEGCAHPDRRPRDPCGPALVRLAR